jgi:hypothetical protein
MKKYTGGINTPTSISVNKAEPSDDRMVVTLKSDLQTLAYAYPLIKVTVEADGNTYQWVGGLQTDLNNWVDEITILQNNVDAIANGEGTAFATRAAAIAAPEANGNPFIVYDESGFNGQYRYDSTATADYVLITLFRGDGTVEENIVGSENYFSGAKIVTKLKAEVGTANVNNADQTKFAQIAAVKDERDARVAEDDLKISKKIGLNLFNKLFFTDDSYISSTGSILTSTSYVVSGFIAALESQQFTKSASFSSATYNSAFYDVNKVYIASSANNIQTVTAPANTAYIRVSVAKSIIDTYRLNLGAVLLDFTPYIETKQLVSNESIIDNSVTTAKIVDANVTASKLASNSVTTAKILDANVTASKLASNSVTSDKINALSVTDSKIDGLSISYEKIQKNVIKPVNAEFFNYSNQLFDFYSENNAIGKYVSTSNGTLLTNATYSTSDFIPCLPSTVYKRRYAHNIAYYDKNKVFISGETANTTITTPLNTYYFRSTSTASTFENQIINLGTVLVDFEAFSETIKQKNSALKTEIAIPVQQYVLSTKQNTIYFQPLLKRFIPNEYFVRLEGSTAWKNYRNLARATSPTDLSGLKVNLYDLEFTKIQEKTINIVVGDITYDTGNINVNAIGDSFTYNGRFVYRLTTLLTNVTPVGMRKSYDPPVATFAEGRGGWTLADYFEDYKGSSSMSFSPFMHPVAPYTYYGGTQFWQSVANGTATGYDVAGFEATQTSIGFNTSNGYKTTPVTNDVMWVNANSQFEVYNGSAWVSILETTLNFSFNYAKYRSTWIIAQPNIVSILLGLNDFRDAESTDIIDAEWSTWTLRMEQIFTSIAADSPSAKIMVCMPSSSVGNMDNNGGFFTVKQNAMMWHVRKKMIPVFEARNADDIYLVDMGIAIDPDYSFEFLTEKPYNDYSASAPWSTYNRKVDVNSPHPSFHGYYNMALPLAGAIQEVRPLL